MESASGCLYVVATPIGNLEDVTQRALRMLADATFVAAEDTRRVRKLLSHHGIHTPTVAYHEANKHKATPEIVDRLVRGARVALVSDAGTPGIADPGSALVRAAAEAGVRVVPIPGPSALTAALSVCGFDTRHVRMLGFLPKRLSERRRVLAGLADETATTVVFEAPGRVGDTLRAMAGIFPQRQVLLLREMTKVFEECIRGTTAEVAVVLTERGELRGEFVIVLEGAPVASGGAPSDEAVRARLHAVLGAGVDKRSAVSAVAAILEVPRSRVYDIAVDLAESL
ncbi:MAG TPA: 16S rRNA (cytidine(1402)-2'-O)-methyltransferase [Armatimonadota bacterium]|nr:16S rRNA (cytidine(1402)-2'-O)-methyltransferase [Armatimonadota bacterium]